jgi:uncharacterized membrane protein
MKPRHLTPADSAPLIRETIPARRSKPSVRSKKGVRVETAVTINRTPEELFAFWRNFENLSRVMEHIESIECLDERRSRWRMRRGDNEHVEWTAEVINEHPGELIAWRSLDGSDVRHAGTIRFTPVAGARGTEVKLTIEFEAAGGSLGNALAKLARRSPEQQAREDLRHFKQLMEAGEIPTTAGQPAGRDKDKSFKYEEAK